MIFHMQMKQINGRNNLAWFKLAGLWVENIFLLNEMTVCDVEINKNHPMRASKDFYLGLALAIESVTITYILKETKNQTEKWENFIEEKR